MSPEQQTLKTIQQVADKFGSTSPKFIKLMDGFQEIFALREKMVKDLAKRFSLWRTMAQLGIAIDSKGYVLDRENQQRPHLVTGLTFKDRIQHRVWQAANYLPSDYRMEGDCNAMKTGILEADLPQWLENRKMKPDDLFCSIYAADTHQVRITHIILNKVTDMPKRAVKFPVPVNFPR